MDIKINEAEPLNKKKMIAFELPDDWYQVLKKGADTELISVSNLIRIILYRNYIESRITEGKDM